MILQFQKVVDQQSAKRMPRNRSENCRHFVCWFDDFDVRWETSRPRDLDRWKPIQKRSGKMWRTEPWVDFVGLGKGQILSPSPVRRTICSKMTTEAPTTRSCQGSSAPWRLKSGFKNSKAKDLWISQHYIYIIISPSLIWSQCIPTYPIDIPFLMFEVWPVVPQRAPTERRPWTSAPRPGRK